MRVFLVAVGLASAAWLGFGAYVLSTPEGQARAAERDVIAKCEDNPAMRPICLKLAADYRQKWHREP